MSSVATSPPASSNKIGDSITAIAAINGSTTSQKSVSFEMPKQSLRGLNKPKCIKCGNVARSRCPFQSCKSCCAKAENPCHIHVLKQSSTLPDKPPPSSSPSLEQPANDVPSNGASWRLHALRQQSTHIANSVRAKKPVTRKDAVNINIWRFMKLREHIQGNIEAENEAFERYASNASLLEETFSIMEGIKIDSLSTSETSSSEDKKRKSVSEIKMKLKVNAGRADSYRKKIRDLIDQKLVRLQEEEHVIDDGSVTDEIDDHRELKRLRKVVKGRSDRNLVLNDLIDKLNRARNEDDLRSCLDLKLQLSNQMDYTDTSNETKPQGHFLSKKETENAPALSLYSVPKVWKAAHIDQDALSRINMEFSSLSQIAEL